MPPPVTRPKTAPKKTGPKVLAKTHEPTAQETAQSQAQVPIANAAASHRILNKGLVSASELGLDDNAYFQNQNEDPPDFVSILRCPPAIAAILRMRIASNFARNSIDSGISEHSNRGPLGLTITPTNKEDYRVFNVCLDIWTQEEVSLLQTWGVDFTIAQFPPQILRPSMESAESKLKAARAPMARGVIKAKSQPLTSVSEAKNQEDVAERPLGTIPLQGLLTELPTLLEIYKSLDMESMVKAANVSQMLLIYFPQDETKFLPTAPTGTNELHTCIERLQMMLDPNEPQDTWLLCDSKKYPAQRCPWMWPSGITPPTHMQRERKHRDFELFKKAEFQTVEFEMMSMLRRGRQEHAVLEIVSAIEGYLQKEALQKQSTVPSAEQVVRPSPESRITYVIPETLTEIFDDAASDLSDTLFDDEPGTEESLLMEGSATAKRRSRDRARGTVQAMSLADAGASSNLNPASLIDEFIVLDQQVLLPSAEDQEAELQAEFYSGAMVANSGSSLVEDGTADEEGADKITSMRKIDRGSLKKRTPRTSSEKKRSKKTDP